MKKYFLVISALFIALTLYSQDLTVDVFQELGNDLAARSAERKDNNGEPCALIKIDVPLTGVQFNPNEVNGSVEYKVNTYWVYLPAGSKRITLQHPQFHTLKVEFATYGISYLEKSTTYLLRINVPVSAPIKKQNMQQYVVFTVQPATAIIEFDGKILELNNGVAQERKPFGTYSYTITANSYHTQTGTIVVNNPDARHEVNIALKPAFGYLSILPINISGATVIIDSKTYEKTTPCSNIRLFSGQHQVQIKKDMYDEINAMVTIADGVTTTFNPAMRARFGYITVSGTELNGGSVYIDDKYVGKAPFTSDKLPEGVHRVRVVTSLYKPSEQDITIGDGKTSYFTNQLESDYAAVLLKVDNNAEIWINGSKKGNGQWKGNLRSGAYLIECKLPNYETSSQEVSIVPASEQRVISLTAPTPIYGSVDINATPSDADVYIDKKLIGKTPIFVSELLIGDHTLQIRKEGYTDYQRPFSLSDSETKTIDVTLSPKTTIHSASDNKEVTFASGNTKSNTSRVTNADTDRSTPEQKNAEHSFSVYKDEKVIFAPGNLQYQASTKTWRFAEHQYDYIGRPNANISSTYTGWIDLFAWGSGDNPTNVDNPSSTFVDWGINIIDGYPAYTWYTLSPSEWYYIFNHRTNASNLFGSASINGIPGLIILPDDWELPKGIIFYTGRFAKNIYTIEEFSKMEAAGAVFLPKQYSRYGLKVSGAEGLYWTDDYYNTVNSYSVSFFTREIEFWHINKKWDGLYVRLARKI